MRRAAVLLSSSRTHHSSSAGSLSLSIFVTPTRSQNARIAAGGKPRRRMAHTVGMRGSSQPETCFSVTSCSRRRFDITVQVMLRRANSRWCGRIFTPLRTMSSPCSSMRSTTQS